MATPHPLERELSAAWPPERWADVTVLVAVSGGADSVALLRSLAAVRVPGPGRLVVGHFNHRLRGEESGLDERFVVELAAGLGLECRLGQAIDSQTTSDGDGLEATARTARYGFLQSTAEQVGARYVVTAHTANDQAETILHHILRGTGLSGLSGMRPARPLGPAVTLVRPLLSVARSDVLDYLAVLDQPFREDQSNADPRFTRNRIRRELLPLLEREYAPQVVDSLLRMGKLAADAQRMIDHLADAVAQRAIVDRSPNSVTLDCRVLSAEDRHLLREVLISVWRGQQWPEQSMGSAQWNQLADLALASANTTAKTFPGAIRAEKRGPNLLLST